MIWEPTLSPKNLNRGSYRRIPGGPFFMRFHLLQEGVKTKKAKAWMDVTQFPEFQF